MVGLVPAAGHATRLQPLQGSKETLPVHGRPVMEYLVERLQLARPTEMRVVTRPEKRDVVSLAVGLGATVVAAHPPTLAASILAGLDELSDADLVLSGFPDSIWQPPDGFVHLRAAVEAGDDLVLGLFRTSDPRRSDVVTFGPQGPIPAARPAPTGRADGTGLAASEWRAVTAISVKPESPSSDWIWGCWAARAGVLRGLREDQEVSVYLDALCRSRPLPGLLLGRIVDIGTPGGLLEARSDPSYLVPEGSPLDGPIAGT